MTLAKRLYGPMVITIFTLSVPTDGTAASSCDVEVALHEAQPEICSSENRVVAAFDHRDRTWTVLRCKKDSLEKDAGPTEKPAIHLGRKEELKTFVVDTNPVIFTADRSATAEAAIDTLANIQAVASGLANIAGVSLQISGTEELQKALGEKATPATPHAPPTLSQLVYDYLEQLNDGAFPDTQVKKLVTAGENIKKEIQGTDEASLLSWLQAIESSPADAPTPPGPSTQSEIRQLFTTLRDARQKVVDGDVPCIKSISALAKVASIKRSKAFWFSEGDRLEAYKSLVKEATDHVDNCPEQLSIATLSLGSWFLEESNLPTPDGPDSEDRRALDVLGEELRKVLDLNKKRDEALTKSKDLLEKESAVILAAARVRNFTDRHSSQKGDRACGVIEVPRSSFKASDVPWTKKRTDTVEVKLDPSLTGKLTLSHPETASGSFTVDRKFARGLEVDFALIDTDLYSSTFEAIDLDGEEGGESRIAETDRSTRSGKVAIMAAYRWPLRAGFAVGPQLGVGLDTDDAAFFYGASLRWRFLVLGWGQTRQKVTALRGQSVDDILSEGETVRTRDRFDTEDYWSLAISITDIPFFQPKD